MLERLLELAAGLLQERLSSSQRWTQAEHGDFMFRLHEAAVARTQRADPLSIGHDRDRWYGATAALRRLCPMAPRLPTPATCSRAYIAAGLIGVCLLAVSWLQPLTLITRRHAGTAPQKRCVKYTTTMPKPNHRRGC